MHWCWYDFGRQRTRTCTGPSGGLAEWVPLLTTVTTRAADAARVTTELAPTAEAYAPGTGRTTFTITAPASAPAFSLASSAQAHRATTILLTPGIRPSTALAIAIALLTTAAAVPATPLERTEGEGEGAPAEGL